MPVIYSALVLAGRRGADDPLAAADRAPHRALLDVAGTPMLERVLRQLTEHPRIGAIAVVIDEPSLLAGYPGLVALRDGGAFELLPARESPSRSVLAALDAWAGRLPMLVTTADHALLDAAMLDAFLAGAEDSGADLAVGLVSRSRIAARFPDARRTYLPFRGESYSGANLFALRSPAARRVVEFWRRVENERKRPWKLVSAFGAASLLLFLLRRLDLAEAMERASRVVGAQVRAVELSMAEAAVDVDKPSDLELVRRIVADRKRSDAPAQSARDASSRKLPLSRS